MKQKSAKTLKNKAWKLFSEYVRRKDADEGGTDRCYTCGKLAHWKELQAGHSIPGRHNAVLLDESICRPQCPVCNVWKRGMYHVFAGKLIKENGLEWWEQKLFYSKKVVKITRGDYEVIIEDLKKKLSALAGLNTRLCPGCEDQTCKTSGCIGA